MGPAPQGPQPVQGGGPKTWDRAQFLRFLMVGMLNTGFSYGVYAALIWLGLPYVWANLGSLVLGILFSFRTQGRLVFRNAANRLFGRFVVAWSVIFVLHTGIIAGFVRVGANAYLAGALALVPVALLSFVVQKFFVFREVRS